LHEFECYSLDGRDILSRAYARETGYAKSIMKSDALRAYNDQVATLLPGERILVKESKGLESSQIKGENRPAINSHSVDCCCVRR
jgi:hypothetical protein